MARLLTIMGVTLIISCPILAGWPFILQQANLFETGREAQQVVQENNPQTAENRRQLEQAHAYNQRLAKTGQPVLGEQADPFTKQAAGDFSGSDDHEYESTLSHQAGIMGVIRIPRISVNLPIRHGASSTVLDEGAGHLHGSSLPVGGKDTHAVITGHRGLNDKQLFTRVGELTYGDFIYIQVEGETLAYKVDRIYVVDPDDVSRLRIIHGQDRLTLLTCTPIGVNTQRLLVSGIRSSIPFQAPPLEDAPKDWKRFTILAVSAGGGVFAASSAGVLLVRRVRRRPLSVSGRVPAHQRHELLG